MANHPLQNMITRAVITAIDTVRKCQTAGLKLIAGEKKENVEHLEPYGFTSAAQNGAEAGWRSGKSRYMTIRGSRSH